MPINPNIALGVQQPQAPDLIGSMGQMMTLKNLSDQMQTREFNNRIAAGEIERKNTLRNLLTTAKNPRDVADILTKYGDDPVGGAKFGMEIDANELRERAGVAFSILNMPPEQRPAAYASWIQSSAQAGKDVSKEPQEYPGDEYLITGLSKVKEYLGQVPEVRGRVASQQAWNRIVGPQDAPVPSVPGVPSGVETKPFNPPQLMPEDGPATIQAPPTLYQAQYTAFNNPDNIERVAAELEAQGFYAEAAKRRKEAVELRKSTEEAQPKDRVVRTLNMLRDQPNMPQAEKQILLDNLAKENGLGEEWTYRLNDKKELVLTQRPEVTQAKDTRAKLGANVTNVGVQAYEKELNKQDAQVVSKAREAAENASSAADQVRLITQTLKGYKGGPLATYTAEFARLFPGTEFEKIATANQLANAIRAKLAPLTRAAGSGATSDFEMRMYLDAIPSLSTTEEGRELMAQMAERLAERAALAADLKDEMVRAGNYSVQRHREEIKKRFGDSFLKPEEKQAMSGSKDYRKLWQ